MDSLTTNAHAFLDICWGQVLSKTDHIFTLVLESNDILCFGSSWVKDLGQAANLEGWALLHHLLVGFDVPLRRHGQSSI